MEKDKIKPMLPLVIGKEVTFHSVIGILTKIRKDDKAEVKVKEMYRDRSWFKTYIVPVGLVKATYKEVIPSPASRVKENNPHEPF